MITASVVITYIATRNYLWLAFVMTYLWGFFDGALCTHTNSIIGFEFESNSQPFACLNMLMSITGSFIQSI